MSDLSDDDALKLLTGASTPAASQSNAVPQAQLSDDDALALLTGARSSPQAAQAEAAKMPPSVGGTIKDRSAGMDAVDAGLVRGVKDVIGSVVPVDAWIANKLGFPQEANRLKTNLANFQAQAPAFNQQNGIPGQIGEFGGQLAATIPAMAVGGGALGAAGDALSTAIPKVAPAINFLSGAYKGNKLVQAASKGVLGAGQGATAAALTSGGSNQPVSQQIQQGAEAGSILGGGGSALFDAGGAVANKLTGGGVSPLKAALAKKAIDMGIPLRGSQISNSPFAKYLDSTVGKIPFAGLEAQNEAQRTAFTKAVAGTMGSNADNLTPQAMSDIRSNLSGNYNAVAARTSIPITGPAGDPLRASFGNTISEASRVLNDSDLKPLQNQVAHILSTADPVSGAIPGDVYKRLTADGGSLDRLTQSKDPNVRFYASQIEKSLNDALTASASPKDAALLKQTNLQWKNMRTVQDLAAKAGIEGEISPTALLGAVKKSYKDMAYSGAGQIGDLAHIGQQFLTQPPSSGSGERMALYSLLGLGGEGIAATAMHDPNALVHAAMTGAGIVGAGRVIGSGLKSHIYRDWLLNSAHTNSAANPLFSGNNLITTGVRRYAIPSGVIGTNQLLLNHSPAPVSQ